jgi:hypothetical protein
MLCAADKRVNRPALSARDSRPAEFARRKTGRANMLGSRGYDTKPSDNAGRWHEHGYLP